MSNEIVLLRGWLRDSRHWESFPTTLVRRIPGATISTPDLPGNGAFYRQVSASTIAKMVDQIRAGMPSAKRIGGSPTATPFAQRRPGLILIGLSMGGMIATEWAQRSSAEVTALILINSSMRPYAKPWQRLQLNAWPRLAGNLLTSTEKREMLIQELTLSPDNRTRERLHTWVRWSLTNPVTRESMRNQLLAAAHYRYSKSIPPQVPTLIVSGLQDRLVSPVCSQQISEAWQAPIVSHPLAGHDLPVEAPDWLADTVADFLDTQNLC